MTQQSLKMKARVYLTYFKDIRLSVKMRDINLNNSRKNELCMYILDKEKNSFIVHSLGLFQGNSFY